MRLLALLAIIMLVCTEGVSARYLTDGSLASSGTGVHEGPLAPPAREPHQSSVWTDLSSALRILLAACQQQHSSQASSVQSQTESLIDTVSTSPIAQTQVPLYSNNQPDTLYYPHTRPAVLPDPLIQSYMNPLFRLNARRHKRSNSSHLINSRPSRRFSAMRGKRAREILMRPARAESKRAWAESAYHDPTEDEVLPAGFNPMRGKRLTDLTEDEISYQGYNPMRGKRLTDNPLEYTEEEIVKLGFNPMRGKRLTDYTEDEISYQGYNPMRGKRLTDNDNPLDFTEEEIVNYRFNPMRGKRLTDYTEDEISYQGYSPMRGKRLTDNPLDNTEDQIANLGFNPMRGKRTLIQSSLNDEPVSGDLKGFKTFDVTTRDERPISNPGVTESNLTPVTYDDNEEEFLRSLNNLIVSHLALLNRQRRYPNLGSAESYPWVTESGQTLNQALLSTDRSGSFEDWDESEIVSGFRFYPMRGKRLSDLLLSRPDLSAASDPEALRTSYQNPRSLEESVIGSESATL